jgi:hypothetical protein
MKLKQKTMGRGGWESKYKIYLAGASLFISFNGLVEWYFKFCCFIFFFLIESMGRGGWESKYKIYLA